MARQTIGTDPLDALVPSKGKTRAKTRPEAAVEVPARAVPRLRVTFQLKADLIERLRNTAYWLSGPPLRLSLTRIVEAGVLGELARLEKEHNKGKAFKPREGELVGGRPVGS